ncbi:MAG: exonuclease SbcCD subunit D [Lachnospiraceae bacterium]|nr:exonuclease SbcCD subunit D [Lachnospiraceae bacterium]
MKFVHLSDLHLGKRVNEYSMMEDQGYILQQILEILREERPDAVVIAGDVYDKSVPSAEAVTLFDSFLSELAAQEKPVLLISGNHDSAERLSFGAGLFEKSQVYIGAVYDGAVPRVMIPDVFGEVHFYLLPFVKPSQVRSAFPEEEIASYTDAMRVAVSHMDLDLSVRNVLVTHQFVAGATRSESEILPVGGSDAVDGAVFDAFDYVALGHLHGPQQVGRPEVRYCGTPLKYSFSEKDQKKSVTIVEMGEKGSVAIRTRELVPLHDLREIRGSYEELVDRRTYEGTRTDDYLHVVLTDEEDVYDAFAKLSTIYPNIMKLEYDNTRTRAGGSVEAAAAAEKLSPIELLGRLYLQQNGQELGNAQKDWAAAMFEELEGREG